MTDRTKQASIADEIRDALKTHGTLSSAGLTPLCASAFDSTDICRVLYDLKRSGAIEIAEERIIGGKGKPVKFYRLNRLIGDKPPTKVNHYNPKLPKPKTLPVVESIEDEPVSAQPPASITPEQEAALVAALSATLTTEIPVTIEEEIAMDEAHATEYADAPCFEPIGMANMAMDSTEMSLAVLMDDADEALMAFADSLLSGNRVWVAMRKLADDAHSTLCDYRLMRSMETK
jgi:hypothetical protein